jgi:hypothetical protein
MTQRPLCAKTFVTCSVRGVNLTTHFHVVPKLRLSEAIPLATLYAFVAWTGDRCAFFFDVKEGWYTTATAHGA